MLHIDITRSFTRRTTEISAVGVRTGILAQQMPRDRTKAIKLQSCLLT